VVWISPRPTYNVKRGVGTLHPSCLKRSKLLLKMWPSPSKNHTVRGSVESASQKPSVAVSHARAQMFDACAFICSVPVAWKWCQYSKQVSRMFGLDTGPRQLREDWRSGSGLMDRRTPTQIGHAKNASGCSRSQRLGTRLSMPVSNGTGRLAL